MDDDDDWTGTPPEGRHARERAQPEFWRAQWQTYALGAGLLMAVVAVFLVVLLVR